MNVLMSRVVIGLLILLAGVLLLLGNLGVDVPVDNVWAFWPVIPLVIGLNWLVLAFRTVGADEDRRVYFSWGQFVTALFVLAIGIIYLGRNLDFFEVDTRLLWNMLWPVLLILVGISLLRGRRTASRSGGRTAFMGGITMGGETPWTLESSSYTAFMGGIELDLTAAEIPEGETLLDLTAIMGSIEVTVPKDLPIVYEGSAILGGVDFLGQEDGGILGSRRIEHQIHSGSDKRLRIQARTIMGGVEIKEAK